MNLKYIKQKIEELKPRLLRQFGVCEIGVFGSWVRGEQTDSSDIDILVEFYRRINLFDLMELQWFLEEVFKRKVDVVPRNNLRKYIGQHILKEVEYV
jgi:predicted nucleotidyltransferase